MHGILFVSNFLSEKHGTRSFVEDLSERFRLNGWQVITTSRQAGRAARLADMVMTTIMQRSHYQVANVDVFSGQAFYWAEIVCAILARLGKPFVISLRGGGLIDFSESRPDRVRKLLINASHVITPSHHLQTYFSGNCENIQYIPNAIDISRYKYRPYDNDTQVLCWLRALHPIYHPELALRVLANLKYDNPQMKLWMIGPEKIAGYREQIKQLARELGIIDRINFVGAIPKIDVPAWLGKGSIYLNTTRYESFGVAVMEAAAIGLPIVTTSVGEIPYLWNDGDEVVLTPDGDEAGMADGVRRIITTPKLGEKLSRNARRKAEQFDWQMILPLWERIFQKYAS